MTTPAMERGFLENLYHPFLNFSAVLAQKLKRTAAMVVSKSVGALMSSTPFSAEPDTRVQQGNNDINNDVYNKEHDPDYHDNGGDAV